MNSPLILSVGGHCPRIASDAFVAPGAAILGDVTLGASSSVWYGSVLRGDTTSIALGAGSNIQDLCVVHADPGFPTTIGSHVDIGHRAIVHGATIEDDVLVGMGAIIMNGAVIGAGSIVGAGAVVLEGMVVPPRSLVLGVPGRIARPVRDEDATSIGRSARSYEELAELHRRARESLKGRLQVPTVVAPLHRRALEHLLEVTSNSTLVYAAT